MKHSNAAALHPRPLATIAQAEARFLIAGGIPVLLASSAIDQSAPTNPEPGHPTRTPPEKMDRKPVPTSPVPEAPPGTLRDTLSRQNGVIVPPKGIDPEMPKEAPPEEGTMRVLPPPGAPTTPFGGEPK